MTPRNIAAVPQAHSPPCGETANGVWPWWLAGPVILLLSLASWAAIIGLAAYLLG